MLVASFAVAQPMNMAQNNIKGTPNLAGIKPVTSSQAQVQSYQLPMVQTVTLDPNSVTTTNGVTTGTITTNVTVTAQQIQQGITRIQQQITQLNSALANANTNLQALQAQQQAISNLNAQPVQATPPVNQ